jgi:hypothetical protein
MWNAPNTGGEGTCRIAVNGAPFGPDVFPGTRTDNTSFTAQSSVTLTNVTDPNLGAGNHTFGLACNERESAINFGETMVSAVVLGPG